MKETQTSLVINVQVWLAHLVKDSAAGYAEKKNPANAPARCTDGCAAGDTCPYNALRYLTDMRSP